MSKKQNGPHKYTFSEPGCYSCEHCKDTLVKYCHGFKKRKNPKRFTSKDPKIKAPKWCPKRLIPSVIRVYRFKDECSAFSGRESLESTDKVKFIYDFPSIIHYLLVFEYHCGISAKDFYENAKNDGCTEFDGFKLQYGDVLEVDNGLKAYSFVYRSAHNCKPAIFDSARIEDKNGR